MKPHEETWDNDMDFEVTVSGPELDRGVDAPREVLTRFAPEMARALLEHVKACGRCDGTGVVARLETRHACPECEDDRATLTKAGVL